MKLLFTSFIIFISSTFIYAQDSVSVLFIGNSYTYVNNLPQMVQDLATSLGDIVYQADQTMGGATLQNHAGNAATYTAIQNEPWDFVVLQAQSQEPSFPDNQVNTETIPYAIQIADSVYANKFCTDVMMFMTWGRQNGDPQWAPISTYEGMQWRLRNAYVRMADSVQGSVSPVGMAWWYVRDNFPSINLYQVDESHPSVEGSYLAACTFYASLFRKPSTGAPYISTLDSVTAGILQFAADLAVLDSLDFWNLRPISEHTQAGYNYAINGSTVNFENTSTKATNYQWDFGDGGNSTATDPAHTYSTSGTYTVNLIASSPCDSDTISYTLTIGSASLPENSQLNARLLTLDEHQFVVDSDAVIDVIKVINMQGEEIINTTDDHLINLQPYSQGVYFIHVTTQAGMITWKVVR